MPSIVQVAVPCPLRQLFDYHSDLPATAWQAGMRVKVPFAGRELIGIVIQAFENREPPSRQLKAISEKLDERALLPETLMQLIIWLSRYYHHPIGECFQAALPKKLRQPDNSAISTDTIWQYRTAADKPLGRKQQQVLELLQTCPDGISESELRQQLGNCKSSLQRLELQGLIYGQQRARLPVFKRSTHDHSLQLNPQQHRVVDSVWQQRQQFQPFLLHGVTGSGKTEVYIELTARMLAEGKQVLILIPEIGLTGQFVERFYSRLGQQLVVMHSAVSDQQRKQAWLLAREGLAKVIIGTRSAVFSPLLNPGLIIIDEEHDGSYKQQDGLRYHARSVAMIRGRNHAIPVLLGSATPALESLYQVQQQRYQLLELTQRAGGANTPEVQLLSTEGLDGSLSAALLQHIKLHIEHGNQVLLFINRRGFAPVLMCHQCDWQARCQHCDARMVVHQQRNILFCHHCGFIQRLPEQCPECEHPQLHHYGAGTEKIEQQLAKQFSGVPVIRIDRDTTQRKTAFSDIVEQIQQGQPQIMVGTQMLAKGHDFHNVTLVGIIDADQGLFSADFRASEVLAQLITQVTGRAGRGQKAGQVLIQTSQPGHPFWKTLLQRGYPVIARELLQERTELQIPPVSNWAVIRAEAAQQTDAMQLLYDAVAILNQHNPSEVLILGPVPALMEKKAGRYRAQLLLSASQRPPLHQLLDNALTAISKLKLARKCRWSVDVDPSELI